MTEFDPASPHGARAALIRGLSRQAPRTVGPLPEAGLLTTRSIAHVK
jgi:hypothetical protein